MLSQCGGTEEEIITKAKKLVAKVPFEKIKVKEGAVADNSGPSVEVKQEQEPEISIKKEEDVKQEKLDEDEKEEETGESMNYYYKFSCIKCSKMFRSSEPCLEHMTEVCLVTPEDLPHIDWQRIWRNALKRGAKNKADQLKMEADKTKDPSEEEIVAQIKKFYAANPNKKNKVVPHLRNIYGRINFIKFGFGKFTEFTERHGL